MAKKSCCHEDDVRKMIVGKARHLFERFGPAKTTISDIARASGMSPAHIYNFFGGKHDIIEAVADSVFSHISEQIAENINICASPYDKMVRMFILIHRYNREHAAPAAEVLQIKLSEGIEGWRYERKFREFVLRTVLDILTGAAVSPELGEEQIRKDAWAILDCMFFGAVYSDMFRSVPPDEYECRIRGQFDLIRSGLLQRGYAVE